MRYTMHRQEVFIQNYFSEQSVIESVRVALLQSDSVSGVFVSGIYSQPGKFAVQLNSNKKHLLTFTYDGSLWIPARSEVAFGFLKLKAVPQQSFKYVNKKWYLHSNCYTTPIHRTGLQSLCVNSRKLPTSDVLQLRTGGEIEVQYETVSDSVIVNIGRSTQQTQGYYQLPQNTQYYIGSVNGRAVSKLWIKSSDSTIGIEGPVPVSDDVCALYVKTTGGFPTCPQWSDSLS